MIEIRTPSRLHFGLLALGPQEPRQFGGVGLMVRRPDVAIRLRARERGGGCTGEGRMSDRAVAFARRFAERAVATGLAPHVPPVHVQVVRVPRPHTGLGTGTQLGMAVGRAMAELLDGPELDVATLADLVGRGQRSAIGAHGSLSGGLLVEGGKTDPARLSPLVARHRFPEQWPIVLIRPDRLRGLAGQRERLAFSKMPAPTPQTTARMCKLVLLGLLPAALECDLDAFGTSLYELQQLAGACFRSAQGGIYADPMLAQVVQFVREQGITGVGQSSWGPTLYAFCEADEQAGQLARAVRQRYHLAAEEVMVTCADNRGSVLWQPTRAEEANRV